ncbi:unnamed protein product [Brassica rapa subsp. narinosa]
MGLAYPLYHPAKVTPLIVADNDQDRLDVLVKMRSEAAWLDWTRTHRLHHCLASSSSLRFQSSFSLHLFFF